MKVELITFKNNLRADYVQRIAELLKIRQVIAESPVEASDMPEGSLGEKRVKDGTFVGTKQQLAEIDIRIDEVNGMLRTLEYVDHVVSNTGNE